MKQVFISYSRKDQVFVDSLIQDLETRGFDCWVDRQDIYGGAIWRENISRSIRQCFAFLIVISPESTVSSVVAQEMGLAEAHRRPIIPIMYKSCGIPPGLDLQLNHLHWVDFETALYDESLFRLETALHSVAGSQSDASLETSRSWKTHLRWIGGVYLCSGVYHLLAVGYFLTGGENFAGDQAAFLRGLGSYEQLFWITTALFQIVGASLLLRSNGSSVPVFLLAWVFYTAYVAWGFNSTDAVLDQVASRSDGIDLGTFIAYGIFSCVVYYLFRLKRHGVFQSPPPPKKDTGIPMNELITKGPMISNEKENVNLRNQRDQKARLN